jgi:hypothetical protein
VSVELSLTLALRLVTYHLFSSCCLSFIGQESVGVKKVGEDILMMSMYDTILKVLE